MSKPQQKPRMVEYDEHDSPSTETHLSVDEKIRTDLENPATTTAYEEGFDASSGIRPESAETGGRIKAPEMKDDPKNDRTPDSIERENSGLADS